MNHKRYFHNLCIKWLVIAYRKKYVWWIYHRSERTRAAVFKSEYFHISEIMKQNFVIFSTMLILRHSMYFLTTLGDDVITYDAQPNTLSLFSTNSILLVIHWWYWCSVCTSCSSVLCGDLTAYTCMYMYVNWLCETLHDAHCDHVRVHYVYMPLFFLHPRVLLHAMYTSQKKLRVKGNVLIIFVSMSSLVWTSFWAVHYFFSSG